MVAIQIINQVGGYHNSYRYTAAWGRYLRENGYALSTPEYHTGLLLDIGSPRIQIICEGYRKVKYLVWENAEDELKFLLAYG